MKANKGRKTLSLAAVISALLALLMLASCALTATTVAPGEETYEYKDGEIKGSGKSGGGLFDKATGLFYGKKSMGRMDEEALSDGDIAYDDFDSDEQIGAGTLTAGEWKDLADISAWKKLINENNWYKIAEDRKLFTDKIIKVTLKDGDAAVFSEKVELLDGDKVIYSAKSNINGEAFLLYNINTKNDTPDAVRVAGKTYELGNSGELTIEASDAGIKCDKLDLMLMIDTTGSMGDELEYIKVELSDMVKRVAEANEALSIRVSVNFYRDEGDEYVVRYYDFRQDINECVAQIEAEHAEGGGDYPEAVHTALDNAVKGHQWRADACKLCFFVLDAPPHSEEDIKGINKQLTESLMKASEAGIRIIPVASSGVDQETEYILRSFAVMTGGTYIFLTNDSGIGGDHLDPTVGDHDIEPLNECMIRVVMENLGLEYKAPVNQQIDGQ